MADLHIRTNNVPRHVIYGYELTAKEREEFDYLEGEELETRQFVRYRGWTYDLGEFQTTRGLPCDSPLRRWSGFSSDSFYSGVVVRYDGDDCESVIMGTFIA
jgi:hypothetical protein